MTNAQTHDDFADYVLIGGGLTNATAAQTIRERDTQGRIVLIGSEPELPYHRPPLSKEYLRGEVSFDEGVRISPAEEYAKKRIETRLGVRADAIDTAAKTVTLSDGGKLRYGKLCLATGSQAKRLDPAKTPGADAPNVLTLRTHADSDRLREHIRAGARAVLIGAGYIGMEVAADCRQKGVEATVIDPNAYPWSKNTSSTFGEFFQRYYEAHGVRFFLDDNAESIERANNGAGDAIAVRTRSGQTLPCDFIVVGVGAKLNLELAKEAGLKVDDKQGVEVNAYLETSAADVYAAGDIAKFTDPVLGKSWHVEHWQNAEWHGQIVGANMAARSASERTPYDHVPWFFSDEFDLHMTLRGDPQGGKSTFVIGSTAVDTDRFLELYLRDDGTLAMGLLISKEMDESATADLLERLIRARTPIADHKEALQSGRITLESLLKPD